MKYITYLKRKNHISNEVFVGDIRAQLDLMQVEEIRPLPYVLQTIMKDEEKIKVPSFMKLGLAGLHRDLQNYNRQFNENKSQHFETFQLPKRSGGYRTITAPNDDIKLAYTQIKNDLLNKLKVLTHQNAWAYTVYRSTYHAVQQHQRNESQWFLKIDIKKFFDNCSQELIKTQLNKIYPFYLNKELTEELAKFATLDDQLPQGTPLSPLLTNILMVPFDHHFSQYCKNNDLIYTRYADDIIISSKQTFSFKHILHKIDEIMEEHHYNFKINTKKTRYGSRNGRNWNLGLMLNKDNQITLGHEYKRQLKVIIHKIYHQELPYQDPHYIGLVAYLKQIEPMYYNHLNSYCIRKYRSSLKMIVG